MLTDAAWIVQGSDNFDHWRTNLTFDPVPFEDPDLGVAVHRGVYETAQILYARFEPLVAEHLASSPFAKVAFTVRRARGNGLGFAVGDGCKRSQWQSVQTTHRCDNTLSIVSATFANRSAMRQTDGSQWYSAEAALRNCGAGGEFQPMGIGTAGLVPV